VRTPRFILSLDSSDSLVPDSELLLDAEESRHLSRVLRLDAGQQCEVYETVSQRSFLCTLTGFDGERSRVKIIKPIERKPDVAVALIMAAVSSSAADEIVEKATELGAVAIHFFSAERSQERLKGERKERRLDRFQRVALAALKQSGSPKPPSIETYESLKSVLEQLHRGPSGEVPIRQPNRLLCSAPEGDGQPAEISSFLTIASEAYEIPAGKLEEVPQSADFYVLIGPEGGWSIEELKLAERFGYVPVTLGPNTLRSETAATAALSVLIALGASTK